MYTDHILNKPRGRAHCTSLSPTRSHDQQHFQSRTVLMLSKQNAVRSEFNPDFSTMNDGAKLVIQSSVSAVDNWIILDRLMVGQTDRKVVYQVIHFKKLQIRYSNLVNKPVQSVWNIAPENKKRWQRDHRATLRSFTETIYFHLAVVRKNSFRENKEIHIDKIDQHTYFIWIFFQIYIRNLNRYSKKTMTHRHMATFLVTASFPTPVSSLTCAALQIEVRWVFLRHVGKLNQRLFFFHNKNFNRTRIIYANTTERKYTTAMDQQNHRSLSFKVAFR